MDYKRAMQAAKSTAEIDDIITKLNFDHDYPEAKKEAFCTEFLPQYIRLAEAELHESYLVPYRNALKHAATRGLSALDAVMNEIAFDDNISSADYTALYEYGLALVRNF